MVFHSLPRATQRRTSSTEVPIYGGSPPVPKGNRRRRESASRRRRRGLPPIYGGKGDKCGGTTHPLSPPLPGCPLGTGRGSYASHKGSLPVPHTLSGGVWGNGAGWREQVQCLGAEPKRSSSGCIAEEAPSEGSTPLWRAHFIGDGDGSPLPPPPCPKATGVGGKKGTKCPMLENSPPYGESKSERRHRPKDLLRTG